MLLFIPYNHLFFSEKLFLIFSEKNLKKTIINFWERKWFPSWNWRCNYLALFWWKCWNPPRTSLKSFFDIFKKNDLIFFRFNFFRFKLFCVNQITNVSQKKMLSKYNNKTWWVSKYPYRNTVIINVYIVQIVFNLFCKIFVSASK